MDTQMIGTILSVTDVEGLSVISIKIENNGGKIPITENRQRFVVVLTVLIRGSSQTAIYGADWDPGVKYLKRKRMFTISEYVTNTNRWRNER